MTRSNALISRILLCSFVATACGGDSPAQPSGSGSGSGSGGGPGGGGPGGGISNRGTVTAVIDGVAYSGIVNAATYTNGVMNVTSNNAALTVSVNFATRAGVGTTPLSAGNTSMNVITTNGTTVTGSWGAGGIFGSGSITISTLTSTGASGTFNFNAPPAPPPSNAGATGTKAVTNGVFNVTF